ncbi:MAG: glucosyltransferase domain-containing protein [Clostridium sp.]|nr:glucosyltransferase domain-containing protein [Clostridium sp.]
MGNRWIEKWKNLERQYKVAFFAALLIGLFTHMYMIVNKLPNHDYIYNIHSDQFEWPLSLGRWFLQIITGVSSYFILPWINGVLAILYASVSAALVVAVLEIKNSIPVILCSALLVTYPAFADTMGYMFTADGFLFALLLVSLGVWFWHRKKGAVGIVGLALCLAFAVGIYQAYLSFAIMLILIRLILDMMENRYENKALLLRGGSALFGGALGMILYYVGLLIVMRMNHTQFADYMGMDTASAPGPHRMISALKKDTAAFAEMFVGGNSSFTAYEILNIVFIAAFLALLIVTAVRQKLYLKKIQAALTVIACLLFIPAAYVFDFLSDEVIYRYMMLYSLVLIYMLFVKLADAYLRGWLADVCAVLTAVIVFNFALISNIGYLNLEYCWEQTYATGIRMQERITMLEDFDADCHLMVTGTIETEGRAWLLDRIPYLIGVDDVNLMRNQEFIRVILMQDLGLSLEGVDPDEKERVLATETYAEMPCWPRAGSVQMIDGVIVVKLSEE